MTLPDLTELQPSLELAEAACLAYDDPNFFASNIQARILRRNGVTIIAPAGSNDTHDWVQNFEAILVQRGHGRTFKGFAEMGDISRESFLAYIKSFPGPWEFGAHSAGCAVALQWALWMAEAGMVPSRVQLLAAPTIWDAAGAAYYQTFNIPTLRIAMYQDPIAALPGLERGGAYESPMLILDPDGHEREKQDLPANWNVIELAMDAAKCHPMPHYLRGIRCFLQAG